MDSAAATIEHTPQPSPAAAEASKADRRFVLLALALTAWVYFPITRNFFIADDFIHLYQIVNWSWQRFLLSMHGGHLYLARNAIFLLSFELFGTTAAAYFWLVFVTHLFTVYVLFRIIRELTDSPHLACFGAALWGMLPAHAGVIGWYSVYGHALATAFTLVVLLGIVRLANGYRPRRFALLGWMVLLLLAATSFGVGIGAVAAMPVAALLLLPASRHRLRVVLAFGLVLVAVRFLYFGVQKLTVDLYGGTTPLLLGRYFWRMHLERIVNLLAYGLYSIGVGVFEPVLDYGGLASDAIIAAFLATLIFVLVSGNWLVRRRIVVCLAIGGAVYGVIAVGRWVMAGGATFAHTARYHYLGTAALMLVVCLVMNEIGQRWRLSPRVKTGLLLAWASVTLIGHLTVGRRINNFNTARRDTGMVVGQIRNAVRTVPSGGIVYIENGGFRPVGALYIEHREEFPGWAGVFCIYFDGDVIAGRRVRFVEKQPKTIQASWLGRRSAGLLVPPERAPATVYQWPPPRAQPDQPPERDEASPPPAPET